MLIKPALLLTEKTELTFIESATQKMGGLTPLYYLDFVNNRAIASGVDVGAISNVPSISGTLALSSLGHLVSGASNGLTIPVSDVIYPITYMVEFVRNTDTGGVEIITQLDLASETNTSSYRVDAGDQVRIAVTNVSLQANVGGNTVINSVPTAVQRAVSRIASNSVMNYRNGTGGTEDTAVTLPSTPSHFRIGTNSAGAHSFTGYVRRVGIALTAADNATLNSISKEFS